MRSLLNDHALIHRNDISAAYRGQTVSDDVWRSCLPSAFPALRTLLLLRRVQPDEGSSRIRIALADDCPRDGNSWR